MRSETELDFIFEMKDTNPRLWWMVASGFLIGVVVAIGLIYLVMTIFKG